MYILPNPFKLPPSSASGKEDPTLDGPQPASQPFSFRLTRFTSRHYFGRALSIWHLIALTLPLDALLLLLDPHLLTNEALAQFLLTTAAGTLGASAALWLLRDVIINLLFALHVTQRRLALQSAWPAIALLAVMVLGTFAELALRFSQVNLATIMVAGMVAFGTVSSILKALKERKQQASRLELDYTARIEQANYTMFVMSVLPLAGVRACSLLGIIGILCGDYPLWAGFGSIAAAALVLAALFPQLEQFTFACVGCGTTTSRALQSSGLCPLCLMEKPDYARLVPSGSESFSQRLLRSLQASKNPSHAPSNDSSGLSNWARAIKDLLEKLTRPQP